MKQALFIWIVLMAQTTIMAQQAMIKEEKIVLRTYPFSDPSPVVNPDRIYPYFRFDGYTNKSQEKEWNMVILENNYIRVFICPDVGGKIWGAIEKSTEKEFIYFNHTAKFRDVAMRGAWSSGGLEYNFGDIGHIPTCATPVDYVIKENPDGSVSCVVGAIDLPSGTKWNVEIRLPKDKAYFETIASWHNTSPLPVTYYHWMNAAAKADGNLEFFYPGNKRIGHGGETGKWPYDNNRKISMYENNNFGIYKSYHVINSYTNFFGGYWHDDDFGFGHYADYDDKPGKKIWIWGLSDQGMIWEDLLTDGDGQYIEFQAGKLFNQAAHSSTFTPFKHREFLPYDSDIMHEIWFPAKNTGGMVAASEYGVLNVIQKGKKAELRLSPLQALQSTISVKLDGEEIFSDRLNLAPLELYTTEIPLNEETSFTIEVGKKQLYYSSNKDACLVNRPIEKATDFDWNSAYGNYVRALELEKQRRYPEAFDFYEKSLQQEATFLPTLARLALACYRKREYEKSLKFCLKALAADTYDPLSNYVYGLAQSKLSNLADAKSAFSIAAQSTTYRSAAFTQLAGLFLREKDFTQSKKYGKKALLFNQSNISALEILAICHRETGNTDQAQIVLDRLLDLDPCNIFVAFEREKQQTKNPFKWVNSITNELPHESFLDLALRYFQRGCIKETQEVLSFAPENPIVSLWLAFLDTNKREEYLEHALKMPAQMIFPHRNATLDVLEHFMASNNHWKLKYYAGIINWKSNHINSAKKLFSQCGSAPDFVGFYLSKARLFNRDQNIEASALKRATEIDNNDWRLNLALVELYLTRKEYSKAENLAKKYHQRYPENAKFGMKYARALLKQRKFNQCIRFLEQFNVLPYEGATDGRNIYHETCLRSAFNELKRENYSKAIEYAQKAKLWPLNLGVGKHYDVDERLDDFVIALSYEKLGKKEKAKKIYQKISDHITPSYLNESSRLYLQILALGKTGHQKQATLKIEESIKKEPGNIYLNWVKKEVSNNSDNDLTTKILNFKEAKQAYDTKYIDPEFELLTDFIRLLKKINF